MRPLLLAMAALLCACGTTRAPEPRVIVREVKVPVPQQRELPSNLRSCGSEPPGFEFRETGNAEAPIGLSPSDASRLRAWVNSAHRCLRALRAWAN